MQLSVKYLLPLYNVIPYSYIATPVLLAEKVNNEDLHLLVFLRAVTNNITPVRHKLDII